MVPYPDQSREDDREEFLELRARVDKAGVTREEVNDAQVDETVQARLGANLEGRSPYIRNQTEVPSITPRRFCLDTLSLKGMQHSQVKPKW